MVESWKFNPLESGFAEEDSELMGQTRCCVGIRKSPLRSKPA